MNSSKTLQKTLRLIEIWEKLLPDYTFDQLLKQPSPDSWSLGQVYVHLIQSTLQFHLKEVEACLQSDRNRLKKKNFRGFMSYHVLGGFPPIKIKVPASDAYTPKQPENKAEIMKGLDSIKQELKTIQSLLDKCRNQGKTEHPGFSFLTADEWFRLVGMHFSHHLRQKDRIHGFLEQA